MDLFFGVGNLEIFGAVAPQMVMLILAVVASHLITIASINNSRVVVTRLAVEILIVHQRLLHPLHITANVVVLHNSVVVAVS